MNAPRIVLFLALLGPCGCANPVVDDKIEALGDEPLPDLEDFQFHRAGQPCVLCHGEYESEGPIMSVGGTIYRSKLSKVPVEGAIVRIWDSFGATWETTTNCVGNFWVEKEDFDPAFPLHVEVAYQLEGGGPLKAQPMASRISRDGSCAGCHQDIASPTQYSPGRVYASPNPADEFIPISTPAGDPPQDHRRGNAGSNRPGCRPGFVACAPFGAAVAAAWCVCSAVPLRGRRRREHPGRCVTSRPSVTFLVLEARCGTLDCHGSIARPLRIYGRQGLRKYVDFTATDPESEVLKAEIRADQGDAEYFPGGLQGTTNGELADNYHSVCGLEPELMDKVRKGQETPDVLSLTRKARLVEKHKGGKIFVPAQSPGDTCITSWLTAPADNPAAFERGDCLEELEGF